MKRLKVGTSEFSTLTGYYCYLTHPGMSPYQVLSFSAEDLRQVLMMMDEEAAAKAAQIKQIVKSEMEKQGAV
jgi:nitrogen regulatory protein PII-like uncharacterized protein